MRGFFTSFRMTAFVVVKAKLAMFHVEHREFCIAESFERHWQSGGR